MSTASLTTVNGKQQQPNYAQIKKSVSFKCCATSFLSKFSSSLTSPKTTIEQQQQRRQRGNSISKKQSIETTNVDKNKVKRKASNLSISSSTKVDNIVEITPFENEDGAISAASPSLSSISPQSEEQKTPAEYENSAGNESPTKKQAHSPSCPVWPIPRLSQLGQANQSVPYISVSNNHRDINKNYNRDKSISPLLITPPPTNATESSETVVVAAHYIQQKSTSTPVTSSSNKPVLYTQIVNTNDSNKALHPSHYNWTNGKMEGDENQQLLTLIKKSSSDFSNIEETVGKSYSQSNSSSDDDEVATPPPTLCNPEQWLSADATVKTAMKSGSRYKSSNSVDMTPRSSAQLMMMNHRYQQQTQQYSNTLSYDDLHRDQSLLKRHHSIKLNNDNSLDRSTSTKSSSLSSSCSIYANTNNSSSSSISIFGKSEFHKKESKAITMWHSTVQKLMQKSLFEKRLNSKLQQYTEKDQAIARFIISELYSTEKSLYQFLIFIRSNYMEPMQIASQSKNPLVKPNDIHVLFYPLPDLISMSEKLLFKLEGFAQGSILQNVSPGVAIGHIFKELEQDFVFFLKYAVHYQGHMKAIRRASNSGYILKIDRESKSSKENNRLGLADYLIAPFQRVPRYGLLIKDLLKHTDTTLPININNDEEYHMNNLIYAQNVIDGLATAMNQVQEKNSKSPFSTSFYSLYTQSSSNLTIQ